MYKENPTINFLVSHTQNIVHLICRYTTRTPHTSPLTLTSYMSDVFFCCLCVSGHLSLPAPNTYTCIHQPVNITTTVFRPPLFIVELRFYIPLPNHSISTRKSRNLLCSYVVCGMPYTESELNSYVCLFLFLHSHR